MSAFPLIDRMWPLILVGADCLVVLGHASSEDVNECRRKSGIDRVIYMVPCG